MANGRQQIQMAIQGLGQANPDQLLTAKRTLELANNAYFLYVTQTSAEKGKLVLSNCSFDGVTLYPTYRKPFDLIFQRAKSKEWCTPEFPHALMSAFCRPRG